MFRVVVFASFVLGAIFLGKLKDWRKNYSTIIFAMFCNLFYIVMYNSNPLWRFEPLPPLNHILFNNILISISMTFIVLPSTTLIYLSNFPNNKRQYPYIALWVFIYAAIEFIMWKMGAITYHNGWNYLWSLIFDIALFSFIRIHFLYPLAAWGISALFSISIWCIFGFPIKA